MAIQDDGMYTARAKDFCAAFNLGVWIAEDLQNNRVENKQFVQLKIPKFPLLFEDNAWKHAWITLGNKIDKRKDVWNISPEFTLLGNRETEKKDSQTRSK